MICIYNDMYDTWAEEHFSSIKEYFLKNNDRRRIYEHINVYLEILSNNRINFEKLITASPIELEAIRDMLDNKPIPRSFHILKEVYKNSFSSSTAKTLKLNGNSYSSYHFVKKLGVKVCPYCNRDYVFNIPTKGEDKRRLSELDHFYSKDKYPLLAMSFFNLVPVCHNCNHIKSNSEKTFINPYDILSSRDLVKFSIKVLYSDFIFNKRSYKLKFKTSPTYSEMFKELKLDRIYPIHKEITSDLILKKYIYNDEYIHDVLTALDNKIDRDDLINVILSTNINDNRLGERPFSKLTKDIWEDLDGKIVIPD